MAGKPLAEPMAGPRPVRLAGGFPPGPGQGFDSRFEAVSAWSEEEAPEASVTARGATGTRASSQSLSDMFSV